MANAYRMYKVSPDGLAARVILSFFASAGIFYVNIMPTIVDALKVGLAFSNKEAGLVSACNTYGGAAGALLITFFVRRVPWKIAAPIMLATLIGIDIVSMLLVHPVPMMMLRFGHGIVAGALVGLSYAVFSRTNNPDRTFGITLAIQTGFGGLAIIVVPLLVGTYGTAALFFTLVAFSTVTLVLIQFLPEYPIVVPKLAAPLNSHVSLIPLSLALISVCLFQAANMSLFAFMIELGRHLGLDIAFISGSLGIAGWVSMLGGVAVAVFSTKHGVFRPVVVGTVISLVGTWMLLYSDVKVVWIVSNFATGITWNFVISHLLGMCARFDRTGKSAALGGFASKIGLASGPMVGSFVLVGDRYDDLIWMAVGTFVVSAASGGIVARGLDRIQEKARFGITL